MTQVNVEGYDVILIKGMPRFRLNKKLIARDKVPVSIQKELISIAQDKESVRVVDAAPDKSTEVAPGSDLFQPGNEAEPADDEHATPPSLGIVNTSTESSDSTYTELELELLEKVENLQRELSNQVASFNAEFDAITPDALGQQLLDDYGIYTALANRDPQLGDIHPMTLAPMNRYDTGLAYVARKTARLSTTELKPATASVEQPNPTAKEAEKSGHQSFAERTAVSFRGESSMHTRQRQNDPISEEAYPEPNLHGMTIRPYW